MVACFYFLFLMTGYHAVLPTLFGVGREAMQGTFEIRINEDDENEAFEYITKKKLNLMQDGTTTSTSWARACGSCSTSGGTARFDGSDGTDG